MAGTSSSKRVSRTIKIYAVVQTGLMALLIYMAMNFQEKLQMLGRAQNFMQGVVASVVIQLLLFYPINRFSVKEAERDLALSAPNIGKEEMKVLAKKTRYSDIIKAAVICFYVTFIWKAPKDPLVLCVLFFSFILTILTYFQCYNFAAKRCMKDPNLNLQKA